MFKRNLYETSDRIAQFLHFFFLFFRLELGRRDEIFAFDHICAQLPQFNLNDKRVIKRMSLLFVNKTRVMPDLSRG